LLLGGCVYGKEEEAAAPADRDRAYPRARAMAPQPDRVVTRDLAGLSPGSGAAGPEYGRGAARQGAGSHDPYHTREIFVQAASFLTPRQAERARRAVARLGPSAVYTAYVDNQLRYRVRIGPLRTAARSERVRAALVRRGYRDAIIIRD
jgi:hypothetical protein